MHIAYIAAGAGGMYCGSCLHDNALVGALQRKGHDVTLIPTYTPLRLDAEDHTGSPVFYGALNVYLEQKSALFRHAPGLVHRLLDSKRLLRWASKKTGSTDPTRLGDLSLSMLQGEHGKQRGELEKLVAWLKELAPDVVHITNSMLLGLARRIRAEVGVPVVCSLQGEDLFVDGLEAPWRDRVRAALRGRARDVDALIATSRFYADYMREYLDAPAELVHPVHVGLDLSGHGERPPLADGRPFVIGYLARLAPEKGLHVLADAFHLLARDVGKDQVRLRISGWLGERDRPYVEDVLARLRDEGLGDAVEHVGEVDRGDKIAFLQSLHVLSVPTVYREPKGLFVLEALANGVPVVLPEHGSFPETIEATGGGLLCAPEDPESLAAGFRELMDDPGRRAGMGESGKEAVRRLYNDDAEAEAMLAIYRRCLQGRAPRAEVRAGD